MCSVIASSDNGVALVVSRNMDWLEDTKTNLWILPRGISRDGQAAQNSLAWTAKYGSLISSAYDIATADGINEKRLLVHVLWLSQSSYGRRDNTVPGLSISLWDQFFLDNFDTVHEAVAYVKSHPFQLLPVLVGSSREISRVHTMIEDNTGDAAIFEYIEGKPVVHHGKDYEVMTNDPPFDEQIKQLMQYEGFGGDRPLPGSTESGDRFVRAAYYQKSLPKANNVREAVAAVLSIARNVSQPFGTIDPSRPNISPTRWRTVTDLTNGTYFFESTTSPNIFWMYLDKLDFSEGAPVKKLDLVNDPDRVSDVSYEFKESKPFDWVRPTE